MYVQTEGQKEQNVDLYVQTEGPKCRNVCMYRQKDKGTKLSTDRQKDKGTKLSTDRQKNRWNKMEKCVYVQTEENDYLRQLCM